MIIPLSWLKEYVGISIKPKILGERLTEIGLGCERIYEQNGETFLELEITPNRPDLLSIIGVAREIAAIEGKKVRYPNLKTNLTPKKSAEILPLNIHPNFFIVPRLTGIIINNVKVKESPKWLVDRLAQVGQQSINNIVDITNFVMWELGNPIHSFDYHKIEGHEMWVKQASGGEKYESVDGISYHLPKDAIIYEDTKKIFDLVGIKGGANSGTYENTKAVFVVVEVDDPVLIRRASQALSLRSEASAIYERGVNRDGTINALKRTADLILATAGGEIASELIDLKKDKFDPWKLQVRINRLNEILGIEIPQKKVFSILDSLNLSPTIAKDLPAGRQGKIECIIPTYRNDLKIEEDLIEEVARLYGYNKFPKTLSTGAIPTYIVPYFKDFKTEEKIKSILIASGFSEIYSYSLVAEKALAELGIDSEKVLRVDNPVNLEFEYLRPTLAIGLINAFEQNESNFEKIQLFELGKVYLGTSLNNAQEPYFLSGISNVKDFFEIKGILERLFQEIGIDYNPGKNIEQVSQGTFFELNLSEILKSAKKEKKFSPIGKYPPIIEDLSVEIKEAIPYEKIVRIIKEQSNLIKNIELLNVYQNKKAFRIVYQSSDRNLTTHDVAPIREKITTALKRDFKAESA